MHGEYRFKRSNDQKEEVSGGRPLDAAGCLSLAAEHFTCGECMSCTVTRPLAISTDESHNNTGTKKKRMEICNGGIQQVQHGRWYLPQ